MPVPFSDEETFFDADVNVSEIVDSQILSVSQAFNTELLSVSNVIDSGMLSLSNGMLSVSQVIGTL